MAKRVTKKTKRAPAKGSRARSPRSQRLPGVEDEPIQELEDLAADYVDADALKRTAKEGLMAAMRRLKVNQYRRNGIKLTLRHGSDSVSVQVRQEVERPADGGEGPAAE